MIFSGYLQFEYSLSSNNFIKELCFKTSSNVDVNLEQQTVSTKSGKKVQKVFYKRVLIVPIKLKVKCQDRKVSVSFSSTEYWSSEILSYLPIELQNFENPKHRETEPSDTKYITHCLTVNIITTFTY